MATTETDITDVLVERFNEQPWHSFARRLEDMIVSAVLQESIPPESREWLSTTQPEKLLTIGKLYLEMEKFLRAALILGIARYHVRALPEHEYYYGLSLLMLAENNETLQEDEKQRRTVLERARTALGYAHILRPEEEVYLVKLFEANALLGDYERICNVMRQDNLSPKITNSPRVKILAGEAFGYGRDDWSNAHSYFSGAASIECSNVLYLLHVAEAAAILQQKPAAVIAPDAMQLLRRVYQMLHENISYQILQDERSTKPVGSKHILGPARELFIDGIRRGSYVTFQDRREFTELRALLEKNNDN